MAYIAKVNIETAARRYKPGEKITGHLSDADVAFLKKHNFIASEDDFSDAAEEAEDGGGDFAGITPPMEALQAPEGIPGITPPGADGDSAGGISYKDESALKKLNKDEIVEYARKHQGMRTLKENGIRLVREGISTPEELMKIAYE